MAIENRRQYCERHGYDFVSEVPVDTSRPACWSKIPALLAALDTHPWALWADSDTLVFNRDLPLEHFCDPAYDLVFQSHEAFFQHIGMPVEQGLARMPINTGVFLVQATDWSRRFLREAYAQTQFVTHGAVWDGIGEQEAMTELLVRNPSDRQRIKYVDGLQAHPRFYRDGDLFVHFYGNHAAHRIPQVECEEILDRWEQANDEGRPFPPDLVRFHWCCIQNRHMDSAGAKPSHYLYTEEQIEASYREAVASLYNEAYAGEYHSLYIVPWQRKHELNAVNLGRVLEQLGPKPVAWLDLACGPAWHFSRFYECACQVGLDLSYAQLLNARKNAPHAHFVCGDMAHAPLAPGSFDLVTNFWAAYCYLNSYELIGRLLADALRWLRPDGALYIEVLQARDLASFNQSNFSGATGFRVVPRSPDYTAWDYYDTGGRHVMLSPPLSFFVEALSPHFDAIETTHDGAFMVHLIATGRRGNL
jgi:SAM-dependent methyltransferase